MKMIPLNMTTKFEYVLHIGNMIVVPVPVAARSKA